MASSVAVLHSAPAHSDTHVTAAPTDDGTSNTTGGAAIAADEQPVVEPVVRVRLGRQRHLDVVRSAPTNQEHFMQQLATIACDIAATWWQRKLAGIR